MVIASYFKSVERDFLETKATVSPFGILKFQNIIPFFAIVLFKGIRLQQDRIMYTVSSPGQI